MRRETIDGAHVETFASWAEFLDVVSAARPGRNTSAGCVESGAEIAWRGTATWAQALDVARAGYRPGDIADAPPVPRQHPAVALAWTQDPSLGIAFDVPTMLSGDPSHWLTMRPLPRPAVRVLFNSGMLANVPPAIVARRGRYVYALVNALAETHRVELWAVSRARVNADAETRILLKPQDQPLDPGTWGFVSAHPAFHRRLIFQRRATYPGGFDGERRMMGKTCEIRGGPGDIVTPTGNAAVWTSDALAQAWLDSVLALQNSTGAAA